VSLQISLTEARAIETAVERPVPAGVDIGERLRAIRRLRRATLRSVAERAGLSESFLSQVERGKANASVASLTRVAAALGVHVADLFEPDQARADPRVLKRARRPTLAFGNLGRKQLLTPRPLEHLEVIAVELDPGGSTGDEPYVHGDSEELVVVLAGRVHVQLGERVYELERGDSIDYRSSTPHRVTNAGDDVAELIWVISPPSY
jgi:transcriptional regulator with XRE-family HTH domain